MRAVIIFLIAFVAVCLVNASLKAQVQDTLFVDELIDIHGIIIRIVIAFVITGPILKFMDKRKSSKISNTRS